MGDLAGLIFLIQGLGRRVKQAEELVGLVIGWHAAENDSGQCCSRGCHLILTLVGGFRDFIRTPLDLLLEVRIEEPLGVHRLGQGSDRANLREQGLEPFVADDSDGVAQIQDWISFPGRDGEQQVAIMHF